MSSQQYNPEDSLGYLVGRAARGLGTRLNRNFGLAGFTDVTCEQWAVLVTLWQKNGQSQQDLASISCKDKTSVTRLIDNMEKHRLVVRIPGKTDKRQKFIYLTPRGHNRRKKLMKIVKRTLKEAQRGIKAADIALCKKILSQVYENTK